MWVVNHGKAATSPVDRSNRGRSVGRMATAVYCQSTPVRAVFADAAGGHE
jgi:hypothetical protein